MKIGNAFPSNYLKASDLNGQMVKVTMERVEIEELDDGHKPVLYFQGKTKGLVLNKTNSKTIEMAFGDETDHWHGHQIELFEMMVDFKGSMVPAIRIRAPRPTVAPAPRPQATAQNNELNPPPAADSDIPF